VPRPNIPIYLIVSDLSGVYTASESMATGGCRLLPQGREGDHSPTRTSKVKSTWRYSPLTYTPSPCAQVLLSKHFTLIPMLYHTSKLIIYLGTCSVDLQIRTVVTSCTTIHIFIHMFLPEGQMDEAWEPSNQQRSSGNRVALDRKELSLDL